MLAATRAVITHVLPQWDRATIDPAVPAFVQLSSRWGETLNGPFDVVHDDSLLMEQQRALLDLIMAPGEPQIRIGYDRRTSLFPLRVRMLSFASSDTNPQLQLADLLASGTAYWLKNRDNKADSFANEIGKTAIGRVGIDMVAPTAKVTPRELGTNTLGGINAVDHIAAYVARKKAERET